MRYRGNQDAEMIKIDILRCSVFTITSRKWWLIILMIYFKMCHPDNVVIFTISVGHK